MKRYSGIILLFASLPGFNQVPKTLSNTDKVYGLSRFWQEVNYNFVYLDKVDRKQWDSLYREMIVTVQETENDYQYYRQLQKFCAFLKDGHTNVYFPKEIRKMVMNNMFGEYRLFLENIDGRAIIVRTNFSKKDEIPAGSEIIEVNGMTTKQYIAGNVAPYIASSGDHTLEDLSVFRLLDGLEGEKYNLKIRKPDGVTISLTLEHKETKEQEVYPALPPRKNLLEFKWCNDQIAYLALNSFGDQEIEKQFRDQLPELYKAKALIIDLRQNGGGNSEFGKNILKYLTNDTILYGARQKTRLHVPTYKAWGVYLTPGDTINGKEEWGWSKEMATESYQSFHDARYHDFPYHGDTVRLKAKRIIVPVVILTGHKTASAAEDFLLYADNQPTMIRMGERTFGSTGQPYEFLLPGDASARVCTKKVYYPDGREFIGKGILPHIEVRATLPEYLAGKDPVLETALRYLAKKIN